MTSGCNLSIIAEQDIDEIITYLAKENSTVAQNFLDSLFDAINNLAEYPGTWSCP